MRPLMKNTRPLWYVGSTNDGEKIETKDANGNYTGDFITVFSVPKRIYISLYPRTSNIFRDVFGITNDADFISSTDLDLEKRGILFKTEPTVNDYAKYDYIITEKLPYLNGYNYGLKVRT